ncbi:MAG: hypothetical protein ACPGII_08185 [Opitutales bacterium]
MPTADSFTALGNGNGFPFCLETVDVLDRGDGNEYDHWVTLGGFKKTDTGSPTQSQINTSLKNAMKLFWNAYQITGTVNLPSDYNVDSVTNSRNPDPDADQLQPLQRVCLTEVPLGFYDSNTEYSSTEDEFNEMRLGIVPVVLKSGNNFLGYGVKNKISADAVTYVDEFASVEIGSIASARFDGTYETIDYDYITLGGIDFVCKARVGDAYSGTADATNLTAYSDFSHYAEIDSLDFYTYT